MAEIIEQYREVITQMIAVSGVLVLLGGAIAVYRNVIMQLIISLQYR